MTIKIHQQNLFGATSSPSVKAVPSALKTTAYKNPPNTTLLGGLDTATLRGDSVYLLRVLSNQYKRGLPSPEAKKQLMHTIKTEMKLKQGLMEPTLLLRDCLLRRNV